jgi:two-component system, NarL family, invasion response regulator UvrY
MGGGDLHDNLSDRELQILLMIGSGKSVHEIAEKLSLSINTINTYRARVFEKLKYPPSKKVDLKSPYKGPKPERD